MKKEKTLMYLIRYFIYALPLIDILIYMCGLRGGVITSNFRLSDILNNNIIYNYNNNEPFNTIFNVINTNLLNGLDSILLLFIESYFVYIIYVIIIELLLDLLMWLPRWAHRKIEK